MAFIVKGSCITIFLLLVNTALFCQNIKYDKHYAVACHNCYEPKYAANIEEVFSYTTTIEIDIWDTRKWFGWGGWKAMNQDWYVRHLGTAKGNINCCGGSFRDCLTRINNWSDQNPTHSVITIFIDKKENWSDNDEPRNPIDLDNLLISIFPKKKIFTPSLLLNGKENLKAASLNNNWFTLDSLKGKIIFVLTNGTEITSRNLLDEYLTSQKNNAICFVAPEIKVENDVETPSGFSEENLLNIVFYNLQYSFRSLAEKINSNNCLSRVYGSPETSETLNELIDGKVNFIAVDDYKLQR